MADGGSDEDDALGEGVARPRRSPAAEAPDRDRRQWPSRAPLLWAGIILAALLVILPVAWPAAVGWLEGRKAESLVRDYATAIAHGDTARALELMRPEDAILPDLAQSVADRVDGGRLASASERIEVLDVRMGDRYGRSQPAFLDYRLGGADYRVELEVHSDEDGTPRIRTPLFQEAYVWVHALGPVSIGSLAVEVSDDDRRADGNGAEAWFVAFPGIYPVERPSGPFLEATTTSGEATVVQGVPLAAWADGQADDASYFHAQLDPVLELADTAAPELAARVEALVQEDVDRCVAAAVGNDPTCLFGVTRPLEPGVRWSVVQPPRVTVLSPARYEVAGPIMSYEGVRAESGETVADTHDYSRIPYTGTIRIDGEQLEISHPWAR